MAHVIEPASSARAKCRGCGERIGAGELRFGERLPNPFGEGDQTLWFHLTCAAFKRPEPFLETLKALPVSPDDAERLESEAKRGIAHRRLPRIDGAGRAPSGRAQCRSCREAVEKGAWRIALVYYEDGRFEPAGFIHVRCARSYLESSDALDNLLDRLKHFSRELSDEDVRELRSELEGSR